MQVFSKISIAGMVCAMAFSQSAYAEAALPTVTIMGKSFYYYQTEKGESLAGIAKKFNWDLQVLTNVNKELSSPLDKNTLIYYPAPSVAKRQKSTSASDIRDAYPLQHKVKNGETVYGIAKNYGIPVQSIYASNPGAVDGIREGQILTIDPSSASDPQVTTDTGEQPADPFFYQVEKNESLYSIAKRFNTSIEDLYRLNPGLSARDLHPGEKLRVMADTKEAQTHVETVVEKQVSALTTYKVKRGDTWTSISQRQGIPEEALRQANPGITHLKRGEMITVPAVEEVEVEKVFIAEDPRESTPEGRRELYNEVHSIADDNADAGEASDEASVVNVAVILSDTDSNKDMEFARGAILAADRLKTRPFSTRLMILDGAKEMTETLSSLNEFSPSLIVTTADKEMPKYIAEYASAKGVALINAFDVKDETYIDNAQVIQYLAPSSYFNDEVSDYIYSTFPDAQVLLAGGMEASDAMGEGIIKRYRDAAGASIEEVEIESLPDYEFDSTSPSTILVYATPSKKDDVKELLEKLTVMRDRNPLADIRVIGRPSWITFADSQKDLFGNNQVLMPTRFYFNSEESESRTFIDDFKDLYGHTPIKSYPVYSATAYDIITYFVPNIATTHGDFNASFMSQPTLQSNISLRRVSNWGGIVNPGVYVIEYAPFGSIRKTALPASR